MTSTSRLGRLALLVLCLLGAGGAPTRATAAPAPASERTRETTPENRRSLPVIPNTQAVPAAGVLGIVSGGLSGTYIRIATDIAAMFSTKVPDLRVLPIVGKGSLQNLSDIMNIRDVDVGIVQSDVLAYLRRDRALGGLVNNIAYVAKLYDEEVHILARREIASAADLTDKRVNVDVKGSGTALTASVIFDLYGVRPILSNDDPETALARLKRGEIDALVYVTGKPARLFGDAGSALHLLALPLNPSVLQIYYPARLTHQDYPGLIPDGAAVDTLAVGAVMAVYNWPRGSERFVRLARFVDGLFDNLASLQTPAQHPKWKQVSLSAQVPGWTRFAATDAWIRQHAAPATAGATTEVARPR